MPAGDASSGESEASLDWTGRLLLKRKGAGQGKICFQMKVLRPIPRLSQAIQYWGPGDFHFNKCPDDASPCGRSGGPEALCVFSTDTDAPWVLALEDCLPRVKAYTRSYVMKRKLQAGATVNR